MNKKERHDREVKVVKLLAEGKKAAEIGEVLELSPRTVETYIDRIRAVYGAINTPHLVAIFFQKQLIK